MRWTSAGLTERAQGRDASGAIAGYWLMRRSRSLDYDFIVNLFEMMTALPRRRASLVVAASDGPGG